MDLWSRKPRDMDKWNVGEVPVDWEGAQYSKCGRTDRGVSAFGQVIGVRVRSNRPAPVAEVKDAESGLQEEDQEAEEASALETLSAKKVKLFDDVKDELPYIHLLNKVLPPTIRVLAWCPNPPPNFDARFSCKERQYKYFFTSPAFLPIPDSPIQGSTREGYLDIEAMQEAASYLVGNHDFRNFCKVDPTKQITNYTRRITLASVDAVAKSEYPCFGTHSAFSSAAGGTASTPSDAMGLYTFTVQGSAFLWHQVRCMIGVLFLVGQGLESPSLVKELFDVTTNPAKPKYEMASDKPLVLWDCMFSTAPEMGRYGLDEKPQGYLDRGLGGDELSWIYAGDDVMGHSAKWARSGIMEDLWRQWRKHKMDEVLAGQLMDLVAFQGSSLQSSPTGLQEASAQLATKANVHAKSTRLFEGHDFAPSRGKYVPVMQKERMDEIDVINARWMARKGIFKRGKEKNGDLEKKDELD
jgi:tRNA pseudouridine38/39 synthase